MNEDLMLKLPFYPYYITSFSEKNGLNLYTAVQCGVYFGKGWVCFLYILYYVCHGKEIFHEVQALNTEWQVDLRMAEMELKVGRVF